MQLVLWLAVSFTLLFPASARSQDRPCLTGRLTHAESVVELRVIFRFEDTRFQTEWFLRSLSPPITTSEVAGSLVTDLGDILQVARAESNRGSAPVTSTVSDGALHATYCFRSTLDDVEKLYVRLGDRQLIITPRPRTWTRVEAHELSKLSNTQVSPGTGYIRYGTMPTVQLLDLLKPDWIVLVRFTVSHDVAARPVFYVELYNPSDEPQPGIDVSLAFTSPSTVRCAEPSPRPATIEVKVQVRTSATRTTIAATDPQFGGPPLVRNAVFTPESCWKLPMFTAPVGNTGLLTPGFATLRYAFDSDTILVEGRLFGAGRDNPTGRTDILQWPWVEVLTQGRAFPPSISARMQRP